MVRQYRNSTTHIYEVVKLGASKSCKCSVCGKSMKRSRSFEGTINPFNRNADGSVRNREQILEGLKLEAKAWEGEAETHEKCVP